MYCSQSPFSLWRTRQVQLFRYLEDKDVFQRHYTRLLARRLIYGQSVSDSGEEAMIGKLKVRAALAWRRRCAWEWAPGLLLPGAMWLGVLVLPLFGVLCGCVPPGLPGLLVWQPQPGCWPGLLGLLSGVLAAGVSW